MPSPQQNDPSHARFRRGAGSPAAPASPPPPVIRDAGGASGEAAAVAAAGPNDFGPVTVGGVPEGVRAGDPAPSVPGAPRPLFGELIAEPAPRDGEAASLFGPPVVDDGWRSGDGLRTADADDPGRTIGIVAIVVGFFVGIVGVFVGIASMRASRRGGLAGTLGAVGVVVSVLNVVVVGAIGLSWVRYEVSLSQQCALVGPGHYLTQSGAGVTCR